MSEEKETTPEEMPEPLSAIVYQPATGPTNVYPSYETPMGAISLVKAALAAERPLLLIPTTSDEVMVAVWLGPGCVVNVKPWALFMAEQQQQAEAQHRQQQAQASLQQAGGRTPANRILVPGRRG